MPLFSNLLTVEKNPLLQAKLPHTALSDWPSEFGLEQPFAKSSELRTESVASYFHQCITNSPIKLFRRLHFEMLMQFDVIFLSETDQKRFSCIIQQRSISLSIFSSLTPVWWVHRLMWYLWSSGRDTKVTASSIPRHFPSLLQDEKINILPQTDVSGAGTSP